LIETSNKEDIAVRGKNSETGVDSSSSILGVVSWNDPFSRNVMQRLSPEEYSRWWCDSKGRGCFQEYVAFLWD